MTRAFVYGFDVPGCTYQRPSRLAVSFVRAAFEYQCDHDAELARLVAEQAEENAQSGEARPKEDPRP